MRYNRKFETSPAIVEKLQKFFISKIFRGALKERNETAENAGHRRNCNMPTGWATITLERLIKKILKSFAIEKIVSLGTGSVDIGNTREGKKVGQPLAEPASEQVVERCYKVIKARLSK